MPKKLTNILCLLIAALLLIASDAWAAAKYTIIFNGHMPENHILTKAERMFAQLVEERTKGEVAVKLYIDAVLGGDARQSKQSGWGHRPCTTARWPPFSGLIPPSAS